MLNETKTYDYTIQVNADYSIDVVRRSVRGSYVEILGSVDSAEIGRARILETLRFNPINARRDMVQDATLCLDRLRGLYDRIVSGELPGTRREAYNTRSLVKHGLLDSGLNATPLALAIDAYDDQPVNAENTLGKRDETQTALSSVVVGPLRAQLETADDMRLTPRAIRKLARVESRYLALNTLVDGIRYHAIARSCK